ncbi:S53 family peptidase [Paraburkholderia pallida]|uniref:Peptidase S53 n=1 Tax=Paraburkholderia pallida TaxID=2547399 RepID=A0A4P7D6U6_9BURK|nr:protease pro-enzyme activation domain-containing protein [Paraburkholderia pallida]QBR03207.1 peptidase S53 [Paraburkholderia pallida]
MRLSMLSAACLCAGSFVVSQSALSAPALATTQTDTKAIVAAASPQDVVDFGVYLPLRHTDKLEALLARLHDPNSPQYHQWLRPADFLAQFGPNPADIEAVKSALAARGLTIVSSNAHGVRVRGSAATVTQTFGAPLEKVTQQSHTRFQAHQALQIPGELAGIELYVVGLSPVPDHHVNAHMRDNAQLPSTDNRYSATGSYWFTDLKQAYDYPAWSAATDGTGVSVAVLMADLIFPGDVKAMFDHENFTAITGKAAPGVTTVLVDGGGVQNGYGSVEASLDVQQVLGGAPGANVTLVSIPNLSNLSIIDGYQYIVDSNKYDIVNSSFGGCELSYTAAYNSGTDYTYLLRAKHDLFLQGNAQGITFVASSGDSSGLECPSTAYVDGGAAPVFVPSVSTPAADPAVTAVGGGNLVTASAPPSLNSKYVRESAYNDPEAPYDPWGRGVNVSGGAWGAGGGVSAVFSRPLYQILANTGSSNWRTVPDVGMQVGGCPVSPATLSCGTDDSSVMTAYGVGIGGGFLGIIGTSVASPEFVGALALFEQQLGSGNHRLGNANYYLYLSGALQTQAGGIQAPAALQLYHRNNPGYDGVAPDSFPSYNYNYVYGNGSPDVRKLFHMTQYPAAGVPQTATNP